MKKVTAVIILFAMLFGLAACGGGSASSPPSGGAAAPAGGPSSTVSRITVARPKDSDNLDPISSVGNTNIWIYNLMLESLVKTSDDGKEILANLAESWTVSDDNKVYTFTLKPGVKFSDGSDVTVEDWVFTYERSLDWPDGNWAFASKNIESVEARDANTFVVNLSAASPATMANLSMFSLGVQSKAYYESVGDDGYVNGFIGTGPYKLKDWKKGEELILERNPYYHREGLPKTDEISFKVVPDDNARAMQLQAGEVDVITFVPPSMLKELSGVSGINIQDNASTETRFIAMNTESEFLSNQSIRRAINLATDNQAIVDMVLFGYGSPGVSFLQGTSAYLNPSIPAPRPDIEAAKTLMEKSGFGGGVTVNMLVSAGNAMEEQIATILKEQWAQIGVTVDIQPEEQANYKTRLYSIDFDTVIDYWTDDVPDPIQFLEAVCVYDLYATFDTNYYEPKLEELNEKQAIEMDGQKRAQYIYEIQQIVADAGIFVPLCYVPYGVAMSDKVSGFIQTPLGNYRFENLVKAP